MSRSNFVKRFGLAMGQQPGACLRAWCRDRAAEAPHHSGGTIEKKAANVGWDYGTPPVRQRGERSSEWRATRSPRPSPIRGRRSTPSSKRPAEDTGGFEPEAGPHFRHRDVGQFKQFARKGIADAVAQVFKRFSLPCQPAPQSSWVQAQFIGDGRHRGAVIVELLPDRVSHPGREIRFGRPYRVLNDPEQALPLDRIGSWWRDPHCGGLHDHPTAGLVEPHRQLQQFAVDRPVEGLINARPRHCIGVGRPERRAARQFESARGAV